MNLEPSHIETPLVIDECNLRLRSARAPLHILVVDDDPFTQTLVHTLLARDFHVIVSSTVHDAVSDYARVMPDLVFLDINMGDAQHNGFSVLHTLQMLDWDANVVMLSGNDTPENIAEATRKGAMGFIGKPFSKDRLMNYVRECEQRKAKSWN